MAVVALIQRVLGISAICLVAVMAPLGPTQRVALLTAFGVGLAVAAVLPDYDRLAARLMGPGVVVMALAPLTGVWVPVQLVSAFGVGVAGFNRSTMNRLVPALGLPLALLALRTGTVVSGPVVGVWVGLVVAVIVLASPVAVIEMGPRLSPAGHTGDRGSGFSVRGSATAVVALLAIVPATVLAAGPVTDAWSDIAPGHFTGVGAGDGDEGGGSSSVHPGLTGGLDVGAPVVLDDQIVLRVDADRPLFWRGATYDNWDGRRWTATIDPAADPTATGDLVSGPAPVRVEQRFTFLGDGLDVALAAWRASTIDVPGRAVAIRADGAIAVSAPLDAGSTWLVASNVTPVTAADLRAADSVGLSADSALYTTYAMEDDVVPQVAALAQEITADAPTTYDKVRAIESWMDRHLTYTRDIPRLEPGSDAVSELLFGSRRGFCEQIGSALVVMLRSLGIPARLVVGYVPGAYDGASGEWLSRGTDAHAWAEVYFPGIGWQGFDPTAGVPLGGDEPTLAGGSPAFSFLSWPPSPLVAGLLAAAVAASLAAMSTIGRRAGRARGRQRRGSVGAPRGGGRSRRWTAPIGRRPQRPPEQVLLARFEVAGRRLGCRWTETMTIRERGEALAAAGVDRSVVDGVVVGLEALVFGRSDRDGADREAEASAALSQLEWCVEVFGAPEVVRMGT